MNDPLARFQKFQLAHAVSHKDEKIYTEGVQNYQAFGVLDKTNRLQIRRVMGLSHSPAYASLLDVCYDGFHGTELILIYSFMRVKIKGKHLQALTIAIEKHECAYIQDYNEQFFTPPQANEAFIELIEVLSKEG